MDLNEIPPTEQFLRHPWESVRAGFFLDVLSSVIGPSESVRILDAGSGDAWFARQLVATHPRASVTCFDPGYGDGARLPDPVPGIEFVAAGPSEQFDVVTLLDVLEHVQNDAAFLAWLTERLRPGGRLLISVPAWPFLFSRHDDALGHFRRYVPSRLAQMLGAASLKIVQSGGLFHTLLPVRATLAAGERLRREHGGDAVNGATHELVWRGGTLLTAHGRERPHGGCADFALRGCAPVAGSGAQLVGAL